MDVLLTIVPPHAATNHVESIQNPEATSIASGGTKNSSFDFAKITRIVLEANDLQDCLFISHLFMKKPYKWDYDDLGCIEGRSFKRKRLKWEACVWSQWQC